MKQEKEMSKEDKKFMQEHYGLKPEKLEELLAAKPAPSSSDKLFQNLERDEEIALTAIHRNMAVSQIRGTAGSTSHQDSTASGDNGTD